MVSKAKTSFLLSLKVEKFFPNHCQISSSCNSKPEGQEINFAALRPRPAKKKNSVFAPEKGDASLTSGDSFTIAKSLLLLIKT